MKKIILLLLFMVVASPWFAQNGMEPKKSYLVSDFNEKSLESMLEVCQKGGFEYLLERTPFSTFGHYQWNPEFAPNDKAVARMAQKAEAVGVHLGLLVHADAISENDAYFVPKYSKDYLREGRVELFSDITEDEIDIALRNNGVINGISSLNLILVENELISYGTLELAGELLLLHRCTRGACGTRKAAHSANAEAYKIWDSPKRYVAPVGTLRDSVRMHLNRRLEATGINCVLQADQPGQELLDGSLRVRQVERWSGEESLGENGCLGWIVVHSADQRRVATSLDDVEWLLSKAAGFDAGYGVFIDRKTLAEHGRLDEILEKMRLWDELRYAGDLTEEQREELRDPYLDWHLEKKDDERLALSQWNFSYRYRCNFVDADSLLIGSEKWEWKTDEECRFGLRIQVDGEVTIRNPMVNTEKGLVMFPCAIKPRQSLVYDFNDVAYVMDENYHKLETVTIEGISVLPEGSSEVTFMCETEREGTVPVVTLRYITSSLMARCRLENHH